MKLVCQLYAPAWGRTFGVKAIDEIKKFFEAVKADGFSAVYLIAIFTDGGADNGFDLVNFHINRAFSDLPADEDMLALTQAAHEIGLEVIVDIIPNHMSNKNTLVRNCLEGISGYEDVLYVVSRKEAEELKKRGVPNFFGQEPYSEVPGFEGQDKYVRCSFCSGRQVNLNWESETVRNYFRMAIGQFKTFGVDGFRVDCGMLLMEDVSKADPSNPLACVNPEKSVKVLREVAGPTTPLYFEWFGPFGLDAFRDDPYSWALDCNYVLTGQQSTHWDDPKLIPLFGGHDQMPLYNKAKIQRFNAKQVRANAELAPAGIIFTDPQTETGYMIPENELGIMPDDHLYDASLDNPNKRYLGRRPIGQFLRYIGWRS